MKTIPSLSTLFAVLAFAFAAAAAEGNALLGTWQLVSAKYGDDTEFSAVPATRVHLKTITATHFLWVIYDEKSRLISASMGGRYNLQGGTYTETVEFYFPDGMKAYLDKKQAFTVAVDGDKFTQTGALSDGTKVAEIWQRVK